MPKQKITEEEIIKSCMKVFWAQGYHNTSMTDLSKACGLHKGSFYHYFDSKESLMEAVIGYLHRQYKNKVFSIAYVETLSAQERLAAFRNYAEQLFFTSENGCLMGNLALETTRTHPRFAKSIQLFFEEWIQALAHIFKSVHQAPLALQLAQESVVEIEGAAMLMRVFGDKDYLYRAHDKIEGKLTID